MIDLIAGGIMLAHSWYDADCCDANDCRPAKPGEIEYREQEATALRGTLSDRYVVKGHGWINADSKNIRPSKDSGAHVCISPHTDLVRCIYLPQGMADNDTERNGRHREDRLAGL